MLSLVVEEKISSGDIHARISKISRIVEMGRTQWRYTELNGRGNTNFCQQLVFLNIRNWDIRTKTTTDKIFKIPGLNLPDLITWLNPFAVQLEVWSFWEWFTNHVTWFTWPLKMFALYFDTYYPIGVMAT